jgi:hypothetical protein
MYSEDYNLDYKLDKYAEKTHEYAGYGILGLMAGSIYLGLESEKNYDNSNKDTHKSLGNLLIWTAISSAVIGAYAYRDDLFDFSDGLTKKHIHALFGLTAVVLMASNLSYSDDHKNNGMLAGGFAITAYSITLF